MSDIGDDRARSRSPISKRERSRSRSPRRNRPPRPFQGGRRVVIRNIPYEVRWQELKDLFRREIGDVSYVELLETPDGKSKGVAVVEFKDPQHAKKAIESYHQYKIKDRAITIREEREKDRQEFMQQQNMRDRGGPDPRMGPGMGPTTAMGTGGINPQILHQLGIEGPITNTVFVANLDYKVTWWKLKDVFKLAGNVVKAEIKEDKNGKSRGMGIVVFEHPMEAVQAVSMFNGQVLFDRNMIVRIDKGPEPEKPKLPSGLKSIGMGLGSGGAPLTNFNQLNNNGCMPMSDPFSKSDMGGNLLGLGVLGSGIGGGSELGMSNLAGLGGMGLGGSGSLNSGGSGGLGMNLPLDLGGLGSGQSKLDNFTGGLSGLGGGNFNNAGALSGLGGVGPSLNSIASGLSGVGGSADRLGMGGGDRLNMDLMGGLADRIGNLDRMDRMVERMGMRESYGNMGGGGNMDRREEGGRRTTRPDNCTVVVKNLPYSVNWQALKEHFRDVGDVKFAEIVMEKGKSTGVGYVRFSNESDAQRAINSKHRSRMERRNIDVGMYRN